MSIEIRDACVMKDFLTNKKYIVLSAGEENNFFTYLEYTYFTPGTKRNSEFELMMGPINTPEGRKISVWYRIKKTKLNEDYLLSALNEFYGVPLSRKQYRKNLRRIQREIEKNVDAWLSFPSL